MFVEIEFVFVDVAPDSCFFTTDVVGVDVVNYPRLIVIPETLEET
jgi:hypothetical protein